MIETENNEVIENKVSAETIDVKEEVKEVLPKIDKLGRAYATGKRKSSIARVWLKLGSGKIIVNGIECEKYFKRETHRIIISQPLEIVARQETYDINCSVIGGGHTGQNEKNMGSQKQEEAFSFLTDRTNILFFVEAVVVKQPLFFYSRFI